MASEMHSLKLPLKYQALELVQYPVVLVDGQYRLVHFNTAFASLLQEIDAVFPPKDLMEVFPDFLQGLFSAESGAKAAKFILIEELKQPATNKYYDLQVSQIDENFDHLELLSVSCIDVTSKRERLQPIKELSEHHLQMLNFTNTGVIIHKNGHIVYSNKRADLLAGLPEAESLKGKEIWPFVSDAFKAKVAERIKMIIDHHSPAEPLEEQFIKMDGTMLDVEVFAFPVNYNGEFAIKSIFTDITGRKNAEHQLVKSRQQYYNLVENLTDVIFQTDIDAKFIYLNASWKTLTGYEIADSLGKSCFDFLFHVHGNEAFLLKVKKLLLYGAQDIQHDLLLLLANKDQRFVEVSLKPIFDDNNQIIGINGIIRDIHDKKITDLEVKRIQRTIKHHQQILVSLTKEESIINGNFHQALEKIVKVTAETLNVSCVNVWAFNENYSVLNCLANYNNNEKKFVEGNALTIDQFPIYFKTLLRDRIIVADDAINDPSVNEFNELYNIPHQIYSMIDVAISKGEQIWGVICVESRGKYYKWSLEDQSFARSIADFISLAHKSSLLSQTQHELIKRENLYRTLIEQASDAVIMLDSDDRFVEVNDAMCKLSGYSRNELLTMSAADLVPKRFIGKIPGARINSKYKDGYFGERIFVNKHGEERIAEISARIFPDGRVQGIGRDITERKRQEQALKDSEARLELALKGADLGVWDFYITENKMVHNKRWAEMLGYYFENTIVNQQFWEKFIHPEDKEKAYSAFQAHLRGETPFYESTVRMLASNGEWRWILDKGKVTEWDKEGNPVRASGIHQDVTTIRDYQQQLIYQRKFLQEIINATPNLIYVRNANNEFVTVNTALTQFLGISAEELLNFNGNKQAPFIEIIKKITERDGEVFYTHKSVLIEEQSILHPVENITYWFKTIKIPLLNDDGGFTEVLSVSMNITEIKNKEQQLSHLNDQLENKVRDRTSMLESANKELETFNYSVSHDLRTPLRSIDIFAYFLDKNYSNQLDKDGLENVRQIRRSIIKMTSLIDNLLIFSKIGRSDQRYGMLDTRDIVDDVLTMFRDRDELLKFKIVISDLPELYGDYQMLRQAFMNLIGNAIKYTRMRKNPVIEIFGYTKNATTTIAIRDNGIGFSMDLKDKLFTAFKRLHSEEQYEGAGVGLAIVERIIKRHNGTVWAESKEDQGSTFYFTLPVKPETTAN